MAKPFAKKFYASKAWKDCRASFISYRITIDGGECQKCHKTQGYIVDHKIELTPVNINDVSVTLNHKNFNFLCLKCHNLKTFGSGESYTIKGLKFDEEGDLVEDDDNWNI